MPTYTYECKKCGHQMDVFHTMSATPRVRCEACGSTRMQRLLGTGAGIIFKGSGFYETDYKQNGKKTETAEKSEGKAESKPEPKAEAKGKSQSESAGKAASGKSGSSDSK